MPDKIIPDFLEISGNISKYQIFWKYLEISGNTAHADKVFA
jgi:hypothetical protein